MNSQPMRDAICTGLVITSAVIVALGTFGFLARVAVELVVMGWHFAGGLLR